MSTFILLGNVMMMMMMMIMMMMIVYELLFCKVFTFVCICLWIMSLHNTAVCF